MVESVDFVAKSASLLYSVDTAILLRVKELPRCGGSSPFSPPCTIIFLYLAVFLKFDWVLINSEPQRHAEGTYYIEWYEAAAARSVSATKRFSTR